MKDVKLEGNEVIIPEHSARIVLSEKIMEIEVEGYKQDVINQLYTICNSLLCVC